MPKKRKKQRAATYPNIVFQVLIEVHRKIVDLSQTTYNSRQFLEKVTLAQ